ncbi:MAG: hypothetical protein H6668_22825 [Ardenticatenaceae bacterium]|nr:hypothetical protein [Ardenticatenaceae bacterium]
MLVQGVDAGDFAEAEEGMMRLTYWPSVMASKGMKGGWGVSGLPAAVTSANFDRTVSSMTSQAEQNVAKVGVDEECRRCRPGETLRAMNRDQRPLIPTPAARLSHCHSSRREGRGWGGAVLFFGQHQIYPSGRTM